MKKILLIQLFTGLLLYSAPTPPNTPITNTAYCYYPISAAVTNVAIAASPTLIVTNKPYFTISPDNSSNALQGTYVIYKHTITNKGNIADRVKLQAISINGYTTTIFWDTNNNGILEPTDLQTNIIGPIAEEAIAKIFVRIDIPSAAAPNSIDITKLSGRPYSIRTNFKLEGSKSGITYVSNLTTILPAINEIISVIAVDRLNNKATRMDGREYLANLDAVISVELKYPPISKDKVFLYYDTEKLPDGSLTNNKTDTKLKLIGSGKHYYAIIPASDPRIKDNALVRIVIEVDDVLFYRTTIPVTNSYDYRIKSIIEQPGKFTVLDNMINPRKGECVKFIYSLEKKSKVKFHIYDIKGDLIAVIVEEEQEKGKYGPYYWCGKNWAGKEVGVGLYFAYFEADGVKQIRKIVVIK